MDDSPRELESESLRSAISGKVTTETLLRFMGYEPGRADPRIAAAAEEALSSLHVLARPRAGFRIIGDAVVEPDGFSCSGIRFESGRVIAENLRGAERIAVFAATAGPELEAWSKRADREGDPLFAYMADCAGTLLAEELADRLAERIGRLAANEGVSVSYRYGPGYCGWDVREQEKLFSLLPAGFCGIGLTGSAMMRPVKSVSGVIGIGETVRKREHRCTICTQRDCFMARYRAVKPA
jgi:hypothetical protein